MFLKLHYRDNNEPVFINVNSIVVIEKIPEQYVYGSLIMTGRYRCDFFVREGIDEIENMLAAVSEFKSNN